MAQASKPVIETVHRLEAYATDLLRRTNAKHRIAFQNRTGFRESMKRPDANVVDKALGVHVADGTKTQSAVGLETMHQPIGFDPLVKLLLDRDENFGVHQIHRNIGLVPDQVFIHRRSVDF